VEVERLELGEDEVGGLGRAKDGLCNSCSMINRLCRVTRISC
jgi:hypothetical protein